MVTTKRFPTTKQGSALPAALTACIGSSARRVWRFKCHQTIFFRVWNFLIEHLIAKRSPDSKVWSFDQSDVDWILASAAILIFIQSDFFPAKHDSFFQKSFCCESLSGKKRGGVCQAWAYLGPSEFPSRKRSFVRGRIIETLLTEWRSYGAGKSPSLWI